MDSVVCAEMLIQFLFALEVVTLPEYVEKLSTFTCDMLLDLPNGLPGITLNPAYKYSSILKYYVAPKA